MTHLDNLLTKIPDLLERRILDIGAGQGDFVRQVRQRGGKIEGIEINPERAQRAGVINASAENIPFGDQTFEFINMAEIIEHVENPVKVLREIRRVLTQNGICYISVPSRFSLKDPHYHLYFINWLPRSWSGPIANYWNKSRLGKYDRQRLEEMHYFTFRKFTNLCQELRLKCRDARPASKSLLIPYKMFRWILPTFHFFLTPRD